MVGRGPQLPDTRSATGSARSPPPPPYALSQVDLTTIFVEFDPAAVRAVIPDGLEIGPKASGGFRFFSAPLGHGITPYVGGLMYVDVTNQTSIDGTHALWLPAAYYSGPAADAFRAHLASTTPRGADVQLVEDGRTVAGFVKLGGVTVFRMSVEPEAGSDPVAVSGVNYYIYPGAAVPMILPVAFSFRSSPARPVALELGPGLPERLRALVPQRVIRATFSRGVSFTLGNAVPFGSRAAGLTAEESKVGILNVLSGLGKGAVLVNRAGQVLFLNEAAQALIGDGIRTTRGLLKTFLRRDQAKLDSAIADALTGSAPESVKLRPIAVERPSGRPSLLIKPLVIGSRREGGAVEEACVLLISDPEARMPVDVTYSLQLLGLTPAEARVASLVGSGMAPQEVARRINNTEGSVRVTLSRVFSKLAIGRQSELSLMVSRLAEMSQ